MNNFELWDILRVPISYVIKGAYYLVPNYAIALLLFALVIKIILFPLGIKQQKNMVKQAKLQPRVDAIRKRYQGRNDQATQQKMNQEVMDLYQKEGYNPMGGCLPLLIQFPILLSLYNVIINPLKYLCNLPADAITGITNKINELFAAYQANPAGIEIPENFVKVLERGRLTGIETVNAIRYFGESHFSEWLGETTLPDFSLFGFDLSAIPAVDFSSAEAIFLFMIPILSFVIAFASMKLNKKLMPQPQTEQAANMNASMKIMDWTMPAMSLFISFGVPAVIGIYWIYQNIFSTVQQVILKKMYPTPTYTPEELKAIEKEMNGKVKKEPVKKSGKTVRSLHHIDDDDYEEPKTAVEETAKTEKKQSPVADLIARGQLKEDAPAPQPEDKEDE